MPVIFFFLIDQGQIYLQLSSTSPKETRKTGTEGRNRIIMLCQICQYKHVSAISVLSIRCANMFCQSMRDRIGPTSVWKAFYPASNNVLQERTEGSSVLKQNRSGPKSIPKPVVSGITAAHTSSQQE